MNTAVRGNIIRDDGQAHQAISSYKPHLIAHARRDSLSATSDSGSDISGDSQLSYNTSATGASTLHDGSENSTWSDDASDRWSRADAFNHGLSEYTFERTEIVPGSIKDWDVSDVQSLSYQLPRNADDHTAIHHDSYPLRPHHAARDGFQPVVPTIQDSCSRFKEESSHEHSAVAHPRRTQQQNRPVPALLRQEDRRKCLVEQLVDAAAELVAVIWPGSLQISPPSSAAASGRSSLRYFVKEVLQRSKTSYNSLQVALWYLAKLKLQGVNTLAQPSGEAGLSVNGTTPLQCGRRMLLTSLILASKYLQDKNFSAKAWSKISGLPASEIISNERLFLNAIGHSLHVHDVDEFLPWSSVVMRCAEDIKIQQAARVRRTWSKVLTWLEAGHSLKQIHILVEEQRATMSCTYSSMLARCHHASPVQQDLTRSVGFSSANFTATASVESTPTTTFCSVQATPSINSSSFADVSANETSGVVCPPAPLLQSRLPTPSFTPRSAAVLESPAASLQGCSVDHQAANALAMMVAQTHILPKSKRWAENPEILPATTSSRRAPTVVPARRPAILRHFSSSTISSHSASSYKPGCSGAMDVASSSFSPDATADDASSMEFDTEMSDLAENESVDEYEEEQFLMESKQLRRRMPRPLGGAAQAAVINASKVAPATCVKRKRSRKSQAESKRCAKAIRSVRQARESAIYYGD